MRGAVGICAAFLIALTAYGAWLAVTPEAVHLTGDEVDYTVVADSITHFHTLNLRKAYTIGKVPQIVPGLQPNHGVDLRGNGYLAPSQGIGLPLLLAPEWGVTRSVRVTRLFMILIAALLAAQLWYLIGLVTDKRAVRVVTWGAVALTLPLLMFSNQVYPEVPGALLVAIALGWIIRRDRPPPYVWVGVLLFWLYLLHPRYAVVTAGLFVVFAHRAWTERAGSENASEARRDALRRLCLPLVVGGALLAVYYLHVFGSLLGPIEAYHHPPGFTPPQTFSQTYALGIGSFLSSQEGIAIWAPVLLLAIVGGVAIALRPRFPNWWISLIVVVDVLVVLPLGSYGSDLPARFAILFVPFLAIGLAYALGSRTVMLAAGVILLVGSLALIPNARKFYIGLYTAPAAVPPMNRVASRLPWSHITDGTDRAVLDRDAATPISGTGPLVLRWPALELRRARYRVTVDCVPARCFDRPASFRLAAPENELHPVSTTELVPTPHDRRPTGVVSVPTIDRIVFPELRLDARHPPERLQVTAQRIGPAERRDTLIRRSIPNAVILLSLIFAGAVLLIVDERRREGRRTTV